MKSQMTYITFDGKVFTSALEAIGHEESLIPVCKLCGKHPNLGYVRHRDAIVIRCGGCRIELECPIDTTRKRETASLEARERWALLMGENDAR